MAEQLWKMPPVIKVYEALGALGDRRVRLEDDTHARVVSSEGDKTYEVETSDGLRKVSSNDNASYWQGYVGYPAIAVLLARGLYEPKSSTVEALAGIPWKELNRKFRNDYTRTLAEVDKHLHERGHDPAAVRAQADAVMEALRKFKPYRGERRRPPAESRKPARR